MDKKTVIGLAIVGLILVISILYFSYSGSQGKVQENQLVSEQESGNELAPVLDTSDQVFSEFDSALAGLD